MSVRHRVEKCHDAEVLGVQSLSCADGDTSGAAVVKGCVGRQSVVCQSVSCQSVGCQCARVQVAELGSGVSERE